MEYNGSFKDRIMVVLNEGMREQERDREQIGKG